MKEWLKANWRYFAIFGGLLAPIMIVGAWGAIKGDQEFLPHVLFREFVIHVPWGICLTMLAVVLMMTAQNQRGMPFAWLTKYVLPFVAVMACAAIQEFGFSVTELFGGRNPFGGDWNRSDIEPWLRAKSIADLFGWAFGALAAMWYHYKAADFLYAARHSALDWKSGKSA